MSKLYREHYDAELQFVGDGGSVVVAPGITMWNLADAWCYTIDELGPDVVFDSLQEALAAQERL